MSLATILSSFWQRKSNGTAAERRLLEPVVQTLPHNAKLALRHCQKVMDKGDAALARSLKAVCLLRLSRFEEAIATCDELRRERNGAALANADVLVFVGFVLAGPQRRRTGLTRQSLDAANKSSNYTTWLSSCMVTSKARPLDARR